MGARDTLHAGYNVVDDEFQIFSADSIKLGRWFGVHAFDVASLTSLTCLLDGVPRRALRAGPSLNLFNVCLSAALTAYLEATCVDDAFKNSLCYFVSGENLRFSHKTLPAPV